MCIGPGVLTSLVPVDLTKLRYEAERRGVDVSWIFKQLIGLILVTLDCFP